MHGNAAGSSRISDLGDLKMSSSDDEAWIVRGPGVKGKRRMGQRQAMVLEPKNVAQRLVDPVTRLSTLNALEQPGAGGARGADLAAAVAPALTDLLTLDATEVPHSVFQRVGLLRARLFSEASMDDWPALYTAMHGGGRLEAECNSAENVVAQAMTKGAAALTREDALSYACGSALWPVMATRDYSVLHAAAGFGSSGEWFQIVLGSNCIANK